MSLPMMWNAGQKRSVARVAQRRHVVEKGVEPHVHHLPEIPRQTNPPGQLRPRQRDVLQAAADERERLVVAGLRAHEIRPLGVQALELLLERREPEEPVLLALALERDLVDRTGLARPELELALEVGAARAVPALVDPLVHEAVVVDELDDLLDLRLVLGIARADEEVVGDVDLRQELLELRRVAVHQLARLDAQLLRRLCHRLAVLVGPGEEEHVFRALPHVPGEDVRRDGRVRVPEVGLRVDVVDRRGHVIRHGRSRIERRPSQTWNAAAGRATIGAPCSAPDR
jgi:hypothetical protein